jgi:hypothetical protein
MQEDERPSEDEATLKPSVLIQHNKKSHEMNNLDDAALSGSGAMDGNMAYQASQGMATFMDNCG